MEEQYRYQNKLEHLKSIPCSPKDVERLKDIYKDYIASVRMAERIETMPDLLTILRKRDELKTDVVDEIIKYLQPIHQQNITRRITVHQQQQRRPPVFNTLPTDVNQRVFQIICEEIGHKWKELARALRVKEGQIDELEIYHRSIQDRVLDILKYHHETCDPRTWRTELLQALSKARRNDIGMKVSNELDIRC